MRKAVKSRLIFLVIAIGCYSAGFYFLPQQIDSELERIITASFALIYFLVLPVLYWWMIIKVGKQKPWKIILIFSLSAAIARFSFAPQIADYFEFIMWLRIPIIGILLVIEFALIAHVVRSLWQARKLKGDPRVHMLNTIKGDVDEKKQQLSITLSYEPASWYYCLPFLSRNHPPSATHLKLLSAYPLHLVFMLIGLFLVSSLTYIVLANISELLALIVASIVAYTLISIVANYRISRYHSVYFLDDNLVLNASFLSMMVLPISNIKTFETGSWSKQQLPESLFLGRGKRANVLISFDRDISCFSMMGMLNEPFDKIYLAVEDCQALANHLSTKLAPLQGE
ncbi:MAG: hypothetical protein ABJV04_03890 [Aliiglaciecola sp.]|uniref:hypothetical protein n=1 Tax=Aliiglaciecola sp. TaxID=1872441 RepID=UPI0032969225